MIPALWRLRQGELGLPAGNVNWEEKGILSVKFLFLPQCLYQALSVLAAMNLGSIALMLLQKARKGRNTNPNSTILAAAHQFFSEMSLAQRSQTGSKLAASSPQMGFICSAVLAYTVFF